MRIRFAVLALHLALLGSAASSVGAQGFPWQDFERRTLKDLVQINEQDDVDDRKRLPNQNRMIMRGKILSSVVHVTYVGESRPVSEVRKEFIKMWAGAYFSQNPGYADHYETEFLFKEGSNEFWIPVQKKVASYFPKELQRGDAVDLYLIRPGGISPKEGKTDWIFLVEEFLKPKK